MALPVVIFLIVKGGGEEQEVDSTGLDSYTLPKVDNSRVVYLSPSHQDDNPYTGVNTTEDVQMGLVALATKKHLESYGIECRIAGRDFTFAEKISTANDMGVGMYIAIHSNAGGGRGCEAFYNPDVEGSSELAELLFASMAQTVPGGGREIQDVYTAERDLDEIKRISMPGVLLEVEFHDDPVLAKWITNNIDAIGEAIAKGAKRYLDAYIIPSQTTSPPPVTQSNPYGS
jgi:N-acetylmuramoyl-L-alanine amidase